MRVKLWLARTAAVLLYARYRTVEFAHRTSVDRGTRALNGRRMIVHAPHSNFNFHSDHSAEQSLCVGAQTRYALHCAVEKYEKKKQKKRKRFVGYFLNARSRARAAPARRTRAHAAHHTSTKSHKDGRVLLRGDSVVWLFALRRVPRGARALRTDRGYVIRRRHLLCTPCEEVGYQDACAWWSAASEAHLVRRRRGKARGRPYRACCAPVPAPCGVPCARKPCISLCP